MPKIVSAENTDISL